MKRKFDRTNVFGQEQFSSFFEKLTMKANDILIGGLALVFIITGGLTLALIYQNTWGWIFILIACVFYPVLLFVL